MILYLLLKKVTFIIYDIIDILKTIDKISIISMIVTRFILEKKKRLNWVGYPLRTVIYFKIIIYQ